MDQQEETTIPTTPSGFDVELAALINRYSGENDSNTPDYILASYMNECLRAFNRAIKSRELWYGVDARGYPLPKNPSGKVEVFG